MGLILFIVFIYLSYKIMLTEKIKSDDDRYALIFFMIIICLAIYVLTLPDPTIQSSSVDMFNGWEY